MLKSKKHVFWEALIVTIAVFIIGLFIGMSVEASNQQELIQYTLESETLLIDALGVLDLTENNNSDCQILITENINLANKIYEEALILEDYEESGKLNDGIKTLHKKYDQLRTLMWIINTKTLEKCPQDYNIIVYLYEYESTNKEIKAKQAVWSRILYLLKQKNNNLVLIPMAANQNLSSLNILINQYNLEKIPAVIINNQEIVYDLESIEEIEKLIN